MAFIELAEEWIVGTYDHGYMVGKSAVTFDAKTGKDRETIRNPEYFRELSDCVEFAYKSMAREKLGSHRKNIPLETAIRELRDFEAELKETIGPIRRIEDRLAREVAK